MESIKHKPVSKHFSLLKLKSKIPDFEPDAACPVEASAESEDWADKRRLRNGAF